MVTFLAFSMTNANAVYDTVSPRGAASSRTMTAAAQRLRATRLEARQHHPQDLLGLPEFAEHVRKPQGKPHFACEVEAEA